MGRCIVLVDAGYLYAAGQVTCLDRQPRRKTVELDVAGVIRLLRDRTTAECCEPYLRTYWYDGAANGLPTAEHQRVSLIDDVKVRLGRINSHGQQKGVDALIYRDLMTLAREKAVSHVYLLGGDGDLIEGVRVAQDYGVHVTLVYVAPGRQGSNVAPELLHEADRRIELTRTDLAPYIRPVTTAGRAARMNLVEGAEMPLLIRQAGQKYARTWLQYATDSNVAILIAAQPRIPARFDAELLAEGEAAVGSLRGHQALRRELRSAFWEEVHKSSVKITGSTDD